MSSLYESYNYDVSYRAIVNSNKVVKVFTERDYIEVNSQISFDIEDSSNTSFNYFTSSIISGIIHNLIFVSKKSNIKLFAYCIIFKDKNQEKFTNNKILNTLFLIEYILIKF